ncbi:efflux RND transporter periplasmic adaptor subunit [Litoribacter alkaliphilus]|uniref:Efflux RND transporter periplasmic adaptor subunit n=1 Tax=Litoribacter ruber TaxID=702568 RepID=A0AAP2G2X4_9BACT|nr:efflux RND transporter periplasmic adaptor subunit [Litoribacter alkaliphilus]MBS9522456.1 efflux RND transporter periplasmic adaptor subunit [Litoribacter alkaliphilus]
MNLLRKIFLLGCCLGFFVSCGENYEKATVKRGNISESVYASGIVKSLGQYQAYATVSGLVDEVYVQEGDTVKIGDPIISIYNESGRLNRESAELARAYADRQANQSRLRDLEIAVELAKSQLENDSLMLERQKRLRSQGVGTETEMERRELNFRNSATQYQSSKIRYQELKREIDFQDRQAYQNLKISRAMEDDFLVTSRVDGVVFSMLREKGELVSPQTPLAVLGQAGKYFLELQVDEYDIVKVRTGQKIFVSMDSYRGQTFEAIVTKINPILNQASKSFTVEAVFTREPEQLFPFLTLEANILIKESKEALLVPRSFVHQDNYVVTEQMDTLEVKLGIRDFQMAELIEGVGEGTKLIRRP